MKKAETVELDQAGQNGARRRASRVGGRNVTNGQRRRASRKATKTATVDERTKRTEADDVEPASTDEDSRRWKQAAVVTTEDETIR